MHTKKSIGYCEFDAWTIYNQPKHRFERKWLRVLKDLHKNDEVQGLLEISACVLKGGGAEWIPPTINGSDSADTTLDFLFPENEFYKYEITLFKADFLPKNKSHIVDSIKVNIL